jgi:Caspase domain
MLSRWLRLCALVALLVLSSNAFALAEKRVALVVGNSNYRSVPVLANPANDARLVANTLSALGFELVGGGAQLNLDKPGFDRAVLSFGRQMQGADVGLFYYAGHGIQVRGSNYLVPVDANLTREADVDFQMLDTQLVLRQMEGSRTKLNLVILDACRNNPFGGRGLRSASGGLAQMQAPDGTLISFATQPGNVAVDGTTGHSPFTEALASTMRKPGLGLFEVFNNVGLAVKKATGGEQQPWLSSSPISGSFYFAGRGSGAVSNGPPAPSAPSLQKDVAALQEQLRRLEQMLKNRDKPEVAAVPPPAQPRRPPPADETPPVSLESLARDFLTVYMYRSQGSLEDVLDFTRKNYAPELKYFGDRMTTAQIVEEQRHYVAKWPLRTFHVKQELTRITCDKARSLCGVSGVLDFHDENPAERKVSEGTATFEFSVIFTPGGPKIVAEDGKVVARR